MIRSVDVERITRRFYEQFKGERQHFLDSIQGISSRAAHERYTSLLLNRLMFLYFIQQKGFLDNDTHYLAHRLALTQQHAPDTFYRCFLLPLFHEGLGSPTHSPGLHRLCGKIPYLDGDLFTRHEIEEQYPTIHIDDAAFERLFAFFHTYQWQLGEAASQQKNVLHPGILGYIFEKYINQQQMGAYYTEEDVTEYIARNTIIPVLFDRLEARYPALFSATGQIWQLLQQQPERYIFPQVCYAHQHSGETTRDYHTRHARYTALIEQIAAGKLHCIDDFITHNLDLCRFALDVIDGLEDIRCVQAVYEQLQQMTILDPTCGSGAFLFAALNILEPLYTACLKRLHAVPNRYNVFKTIITHNLYGVDMMAEAAEICKLRLFLKLIAQIEQVDDIEPLPHIEHNIRAGNALVGLLTSDDASVDQATLDQRLARTYALDPQDASAFTHWRESHQPFHWCSEFADILARGGFDVIIGNPPYVEYDPKKFPYRLLDFTTLACSNLYPCVIERSQRLLNPASRQGMILPLAAFATRNMIPFIEGFLRWFPCTWLSFYHFRPSMLFSGGKIASIPIVISLAKTAGPEQRFSTSVMKWSAEDRPLLFPLLSYCRITVPRDPDNRYYYPKFGSPIENSIMRKILQQQKVSGYLAKSRSGTSARAMSYRSAGGLYWKIFVNFAWPYHTTSNKQCTFQPQYDCDIFVALFNSSLFWWYYTATFDTFNLKDYMLFGFRFTYPQDPALLQALKIQCQRLMSDFKKNACHLKRGETGSYTIYAKKSKSIINDIDRLLAQHYHFTEEELDFIIHYDIKYRMGIKGGFEE